MDKATDYQTILNLLNSSDDGYVLLDENADVIAASTEAGRMLGIGQPDMLGKPLISLIKNDQSGADAMVSALGNHKREDVFVIGQNGRHLLFSLRNASPEDHVTFIQMYDLDGLDYRKKRASKSSQPVASGFLSSNRTRPDFSVQRRLSPQLHRVLSRGERAIQQGARVLISGETGVGKTEVARYLHASVSDATDPFVVVNCATSSAEDLNALLFSKEGSNSGAISKAMGGTLFLDEVAEIPLSVQARLVGFLEDASRGPSGFEATALPNLRVICATNADLEQKVSEGKFRADLFYRISVVKIGIPPLRQMPSLINHLTDRFLLTINQRRKVPVIIPDRFREILNDYSFPGNIRELLNIVQKATIFMEDAEDMEDLIGELIETKSLDEDLPEAVTLDLKTEVRRFERSLIDKAIRAHGSKRKAAEALGVDIGTISRKTNPKAAMEQKSEQSVAES